MRRPAPIPVSRMSMVVVVAFAGMVVAPGASAAPDPFGAEVVDERAQRELANELMARGEAHRAAGNHTEAARAYAAAFDALAQRERPDADERLAVNLAVDELVLAQEADPENLALLEEEAALLGRYEARHGAVSPGLARELVRVTGKIDELRPQEVTTTAEAEAEAPGSEVGVTPGREPVEPVDGEHALAGSPSPPQSPWYEWTLVGSGTAAFVGGIGLVGAGAWTFGAADERRDRQIDALEANPYPDETGLREQLDQWHRRGRNLATWRVVGGAALAGVGIGLTSWGAWRLRRQRRAANAIATGPRPSSYPPDPPSGKHLFSAGIVITASATVVRSALAFICTNESNLDGCSAGGWVGVPAAAVSTWIGMGLLGGGAARLGTRLAHQDGLHGRTSTTPRERLGWALFGSGVAWWVVSRATVFALFVDAFTLFGEGGDLTPAWIVDQVGWSTSMPVAAAGLVIALHGRAYRKGRPGFERIRPNVAMQPSLSLLPGGGAVVVSGRF